MAGPVDILVVPTTALVAGLVPPFSLGSNWLRRAEALQFPSAIPLSVRVPRC